MIVVVTLVVAVLALVAVSAVVLTSGGGAKSSGTIGGQSSSSSPASSAVLVSSSGAPLQITVKETVSDGPEAAAGEDAYIYVLTLTNTGTRSYGVNSSFITLITSSAGVYDSAPFLQAMLHSLSAVTLIEGQSTSGQVAFQFPSTQTPSKLEFKNLAQGVDELVANLPVPSAWVSNIGLPSSTLTGPNSGFLSIGYSLGNDTFYYYTGEIITLHASISDLFTKGPASVTLNTLALASSDTGFTLLSISPNLPLTVDAGGNVTVIVDVLDDASSFAGQLVLNGTTG